jgi:hypothetical protein
MQMIMSFILFFIWSKYDAERWLESIQGYLLMQVVSSPEYAETRFLFRQLLRVES